MKSMVKMMMAAYWNAMKNGESERAREFFRAARRVARLAVSGESEHEADAESWLMYRRAVAYNEVSSVAVM